MSNHRTLSWSAVLRDMKADRAAPSPVREERLRTTAGLRSDPPVALSAWRGQSGRRYVVAVHDLNLDVLDQAAGAVCIAVVRTETGIARIADATMGLTRTETVEWLCTVHRAGATELHLHRLAETAVERAAVVADLAVL